MPCSGRRLSEIFDIFTVRVQASDMAVTLVGSAFEDLAWVMKFEATNITYMIRESRFGKGTLKGSSTGAGVQWIQERCQVGCVKKRLPSV